MKGEKSSTARNKLIKTRSKLKLKGITLSHHLFKGWDTSKIGMSSGRRCEAAEDRKGADKLHITASIADHFFVTQVIFVAGHLLLDIHCLSKLVTKIPVFPCTFDLGRTF